MYKNIYLCLLLTALVIQQGYGSKTGMQRLGEGDVIQEKPVVKKIKKKTKKNQKITMINQHHTKQNNKN
jgi:hypothetical protein